MAVCGVRCDVAQCQNASAPEGLRHLGIGRNLGFRVEVVRRAPSWT
jgi:hypothetical protein